ncbi:MAG: Rrf2 family transcriptional regulator [Leptospirales bacterium]|nr:Rrf2 family transcriptional regulator [Leptospirales bacterium]
MSYSLAYSQAILALIFVHDKQNLKGYEFVSARDLSQTLNIPAPSVARILRLLTQSRILETREGYGGGVRIARSAEEISLLDIFQSIEQGKPLFRTNLRINVKDSRPQRLLARISAALQATESEMQASLRKVTLRQLLGPGGASRKSSRS